MEVGSPPSCPLPTGPLSELFKGRTTEPEQKALREEMRSRLHPITCRICRQELAYYRDVGRFPLEEREVQGAYVAGRGYRFLLTVWWGRVMDHLSGDLKEMPAVSSYYRHMSFHLGVRTERDPAVETAPEEGTSFLARSGGFTSAPVAHAERPPEPPRAPVPASSFPTFVSVPVPSGEGTDHASWAPARVEGARSEHSVLKMARTMVELNDLSERRLRAEPTPSAATRSSRARAPTTEWLGRAAGSADSGGYAISVSSTGIEPKRRRHAP